MPANKSTRTRPLSPFMLGTYYRFQLTSLLSITHRITGVMLTMGTVVVTAWLVAGASGPGAYAAYIRLVHSVPAQIVLVGWSWALVYHLCNGVRHLVWDAGYCLELNEVYAGGWAVLTASVVLTGVLWATACLT